MNVELKQRLIDLPPPDDHHRQAELSAWAQSVGWL